MSLPGLTWRILAHRRDHFSGQALDLRFRPSDRVEFDELVVGDWFHMEQCNDRNWYMYVGDVRLDVYIPVKGKAVVTVGDD